MADKLLLCISSRQVTAAHWRGGRIADSRVFDNDEAGLAAFAEHIAATAAVPAYVMVDAVEEDYRFETLPHAFGSDRRDMIRRKLRQHYRGTAYATAVPLGRETGKRRDDQYLFCALTNPDLVAGWMQALAARGLPVAGVYLLPMVSAGLIDELRLKAASMLIVSPQSGGLRLTYFQGGRFRLSRLTSMEDARSGSAAPIAEEIANTRIYLHALRAATLEEALTVVLLDRNDELGQAVQDVTADNPGIECLRLGSRELSARLGIAPPLLELSAHTVFLRVLARRVPNANLAASAITAGFRHHQVRRAIHAAAGATALVAACWSALNVWQTTEVRTERASLARQTATVLAQYQDAARQFPDAPASAETLMRAVHVAGRLKERARTPEMLMAIVSRALDASPGIMITELGWKFGVSEAASSRPGAAAAPSPPSGAGSVSARRQSGYLEGEVRPFRGDYRAAIETINALARQLASDPAVAQVRIVRLPLNVNPSLALSGNTLDSREQAGAADFAVSILLKAGL